nr:MAG TPA: hypothetical protein [Bacteriophage sp.]
MFAMYCIISVLMRSASILLGRLLLNVAERR